MNVAIPPIAKPPPSLAAATSLTYVSDWDRIANGSLDTSISRGFSQPDASARNARGKPLQSDVTPSLTYVSGWERIRTSGGERPEETSIPGGFEEFLAGWHAGCLQGGAVKFDFQIVLITTFK